MPVPDELVPSEDPLEDSTLDRSVSMRAQLGEVDVRPDGGAMVVRLSGEVDLSLSEELARACEECLTASRPIKVDAGALTFIDSTGIGFVVRLAAAEKAAGRTLPVVNASRRTAETLSLTGLGHLLDIEPAPVN